MKLLFITLFAEFIRENFSHSILKRAVDAGHIELHFVNPREYTEDKHKSVDDTPFGGGAGMLLKAAPIIKAIEHGKSLLPQAKVIMLSPDGRIFEQKTAELLAGFNELIFVCGHYEGFDERIKNYIDYNVCIGDYILTGGELAAMVISDAVCRLVPGVLGKIESASLESFSDYLLEYPQYTRPAQDGYGAVPQVLLGGNHADIEKWRRKKMLEKTWKLRPDLLVKTQLKKGDGELLLQIIEEEND